MKCVKILLCLVMFACSFAAKGEGFDDITREQARQLVDSMVTLTNWTINVGALDKMKLKDMAMELSVDNDCFTIDVTIPQFNIGSEEGVRELLRYTMALNARAKGEAGVRSAEFLCGLLTRAGYNVQGRYSNEREVVASVIVTPEEYRAMHTGGVEEFGIDKNMALNELIAQFDIGMRQGAADEEDMTWAGARLDGRYITMAMMRTDLDALIMSGISDVKLKDLMVRGILGEMGSPFYFNILKRIGSDLKLLGIKIDLRSVSGAQRVLNISWDELLREREETDTDKAKLALDMYIESANNAFDEDELADSGILKAEMRYNAPYIEMIYMLDTDDETIDGMDTTETIAHLWEVVSSDENKKCLEQMAPLGIEGQSFIYCNPEGKVLKISFIVEEIFGETPERAKIPDADMFEI